MELDWAGGLGLNQLEVDWARHWLRVCLIRTASEQFQFRNCSVSVWVAMAAPSGLIDGVVLGPAQGFVSGPPVASHQSSWRWILKACLQHPDFVQIKHLLLAPSLLVTFLYCFLEEHNVCPIKEQNEEWLHVFHAAAWYVK